MLTFITILLKDLLSLYPTSSTLDTPQIRNISLYSPMQLRIIPLFTIMGSGSTNAKLFPLLIMILTSLMSNPQLLPSPSMGNCFLSVPHMELSTATQSPMEHYSQPSSTKSISEINQSKMESSQSVSHPMA